MTAIFKMADIEYTVILHFAIKSCRLVLYLNDFGVKSYIFHYVDSKFGHMNLIIGFLEPYINPRMQTFC